MVAHAPPPAARDGVTSVVFSGDIDRVQAAFNIAVGAASSLGPVLMRRLMGRFRVPAVDQMVELAHSLDAGVATCLAGRARQRRQPVHLSSTDLSPERRIP